MIFPVLAAATLLMGLAAAVGLGLVVVLFFRQQAQIEALRHTLERIERATMDGGADARKRLEDQGRQVESLTAELTPVAAAAQETARQVEHEVAPVLARLGGEVEDLTREVGTLGRRLEDVERREISTEAGIQSVRGEWERIQGQVSKSEQQLARFEADRAQEEARLRALRGAVGQLKGTVEDRIAVQDDRLERLESGPRAQLEAAASGGDTRAAVAKPTPAPQPTEARRVKAKPDVGDDDNGGRWIFLVMAALLGIAMIAQYIRANG